MIKLIIFDLDGTLLNADYIIEHPQELIRLI